MEPTVVPGFYAYGIRVFPSCAESGLHHIKLGGGALAEKEA